MTGPHSVRPGDIVGQRYRIERELGRGGMAVVYLAHDTKHEREVALKVLSWELSSAVGEQRFLQEIKLTAALQHPHILAVYDSGVLDDGTLFYVMPFVEGASLRQRLDADGRLPLGNVVQITREVADALAFAHERGIVHRDIKPENVLFLGGHALLADFGIARMLSPGTAERLTIQGSVLGTPAYMSPEQALGMPVDGRSDVYSLACVAYEMIAGKVPFPGAGGGVWVEGRLSRKPPSLSAQMPELSRELDDVLIRALTPSPSDRFQSAREFVDALASAAGEGPRAITGRLVVSRARRTGLLAGFAIAAVALVGTAMFTTPTLRDGLVSMGLVKLDSNRLLVAPFQGADARNAAATATAERLLREELARWDDVHVLSASSVADAIGDTARLTIDRAIRAARKSRAGLVVWGRAQPDAGGLRLDVQLFDGRSAANRADLATHVAVGQEPQPDSIRALAAMLLGAGGEGGGGGAEAPVAPAVQRAAGTTHSLRAWRAYADGHRALAEWRLPAAESAFAVAAAGDPRFPQPRVWLSQTMVWRRRGARSEWRRYVEEALLLRDKLDTTEMLLARAIQALGNREDPRACDAYSALVARDSLSAIGWLGLGDCRAIDSVVLRDARSPSGFSFRGSFSRAMSAYERATRLAPGAHAALPLSFVEKVLLTSSDRYRHGVAANPAQATTLFAARPSASGDTVAYVPRPIVGNALPPDPPNFEEGLQRNRALLLDYVTAWVQRAPSSVDAFEALASAQESRGELMRTSPNGELSALAALDSARRLPANAEARARIVAAQVRVLLKSGEFARARALTDSVLANASNASAREAHWFAGIAALTGRARDAARLARLGQTPPVDWGDTLAPPLADAATTLLLHAAYGLCGPEFAAAFDRLDDLIESYAAPAYRSATRDELTRRTRLLSVPCLGAKVIAGAAASAWERMAQSQARGDKGATRAAFDTLLTARRYRRPGATALDYTFFEATLLAAIGDTTAALRHLDRSLNALPTLNRNAVWELAQSATVGRAMAWRADLANRRGDAQTAKRWATAVLELWKNGDADLRPVLSRMREIAGS